MRRLVPDLTPDSIPHPPRDPPRIPPRYLRCGSAARSRQLAAARREDDPLARRRRLRVHQGPAARRRRRRAGARRRRVVAGGGGAEARRARGGRPRRPPRVLREHPPACVPAAVDAEARRKRLEEPRYASVAPPPESRLPRPADQSPPPLRPGLHPGGAGEAKGRTPRFDLGLDLPYAVKMREVRAPLALPPPARPSQTAPSLRRRARYSAARSSSRR